MKRNYQILGISTLTLLIGCGQVGIDKPQASTITNQESRALMLPPDITFYPEDEGGGSGNGCTTATMDYDSSILPPGLGIGVGAFGAALVGGFGIGNGGDQSLQTTDQQAPATASLTISFKAQRNENDLLPTRAIVSIVVQGIAQPIEHQVDELHFQGQDPVNPNTVFTGETAGNTIGLTAPAGSGVDLSEMPGFEMQIIYFYPTPRNDLEPGQEDSIISQGAQDGC